MRIQEFASMITCGGCKNITTLSSKHTCKICGRMLCGKCGDFCDYHTCPKGGAHAWTEDDSGKWCVKCFQRDAHPKKTK